MRRLLLLVALATPAAPTFDEPAFERFMDDAARFERKLYGCAPDAWERSQCNAARATYDYALEQRVWREGRELFGGR